MGVGKTATCMKLKEKLDNAVFLDGDWCWDANPFTVTEETKKMVMENIFFLLNQFIHCSAYENIIFCWVMHQQQIIDDIVDALDLSECKLKCISLTCTQEALINRLSMDIESGIRNADIIERSIARLPLYDQLNTVKINVSYINPAEAAELISNL